MRVTTIAALAGAAAHDAVAPDRSRRHGRGRQKRERDGEKIVVHGE